MPFELAREVEDRVDRVARSLRHTRLNGRYASALGRLYSVSKAVCIARLVHVGTPQYDWRLVFDEFGQAWPGTREQADLLARLRPYYEQLRGTSDCVIIAPRDEAQLLDDAANCLKDVVVASRQLSTAESRALRRPHRVSQDASRDHEDRKRG